MVLLTNGDSWTQGDSPAQEINWNATQNLDWYHIPPAFGLSYQDNKNFDSKILNKFYDSNVWPKVLGKKLGLNTYNSGRLGVGNRSIVKSTITTINYLKKEKNIHDIFVILGFSSKYREQMIQLGKKNKYHVSPIHIHQLSEESFKKFHFDFFMDEFCLQVYTIEKWLQELKIPYLFFNAFEDQNDIKESKFYNLDLTKWVDNSLDSHFKNHVEKKFNTNMGNNDEYFKASHPTDISHISWAEYLYEYIVKNKVMEK